MFKFETTKKCFHVMDKSRINKRYFSGHKLSFKEDTNFKGHHSKGYIITMEAKEETHEEYTKKFITRNT